MGYDLAITTNKTTSTQLVKYICTTSDWLYNHT